MRPLSLHTSALNDAEYNLFTENLGSLLDADCDDPDAQTLSIREVRAWLRGRYPGVPAATIDRILSLFPGKDSIHGGEFFAVLRLVLHVEAGKDLDRALAFVQVYPESAVSVSAVPVSSPAPAVTPTPTSKDDSAPSPPSSRTPQRHNPFLPSTPTLTRSKTAPPSSPAPVLPPRKAPPAPLPPPRHPPLPPRSLSPPKPPSSGHITSTLMKQSLQASKTGQWLKQGQARLEQERVLQVLRTTSSTPRPATAVTSEPEQSSSSSDSGRSRPLSSIPPSVSSLEQVALAASPSASLHRAFDDAYREHDTTLPPPQHPDRKSAPPSASSRASASSGSSSRLRASPERVRDKPEPPPKPRSLTSAATQSPFASPLNQTRLTRSNSLRPSPPPPSAGRTGRVRPESVHALLSTIGGSLHLPESPFGDPVGPRREEREALVPRQQQQPESMVDESDSDSDADIDANGRWAGAERFDDSDVDAGQRDSVPSRWRSEPGVDRRERDSLKWPVDVEGEGWRPL